MKTLIYIQYVQLSTFKGCNTTELTLGKNNVHILIFCRFSHSKTFERPKHTARYSPVPTNLSNILLWKFDAWQKLCQLLGRNQAF